MVSASHEGTFSIVGSQSWSPLMRICEGIAHLSAAPPVPVGKGLLSRSRDRD
jgi:hypothetical protein